MSSIFKKMNAQKIKSLCLFSFFISGDSWKTKTISNQKPLVYILSPQRCLSSARAHAEISRCTFQHDTAFDKVCNTTLKRALALFSNLSFSYDLDEIWIYRFLKTRTRTHATCTNTQYPHTQLECSWRTEVYTGKPVLLEGARCSEPPDSAIWMTCCANHQQSLLQTWFEIQSLKSIGEHNTTGLR